MQTIDTVTYTYKGVQQVAWQGETADFYAFEGDKAGAHKYLIFEEAERDTSNGPLHFHMRYGSESIDSLVNNTTWAPTIVSYDTTIDELKVFMGGDDPTLEEWAGTWNSITEYFSETAVTTTINTGAEQLRNKWGSEFTALTGEALKYLFTLALQTEGFKSLKVEDDTITFYPNIDAGGTAIASITYAFREEESDDGESIYAFDGDSAGAYQYIRIVEPETEPSDGALCFHIQYTDDSAKFTSLFFWPVVVKTDTTVTQITKTLEGVLTSI